MEKYLEKSNLIETIFQLNEFILINHDIQSNSISNKLVNILIEIRDNDNDFNFSEVVYLIDGLIYEITTFTKTLKEGMDYEFKKAQIRIDNLIKTKELITKNIYISFNYELNYNVLLIEKFSNINLNITYI